LIRTKQHQRDENRCTNFGMLRNSFRWRIHITISVSKTENIKMG
jgi:hypothetical protein